MNSLHKQDYIELITRLRVIRKNKKITQSSLAKKLNVTQSMISKVENCERKLDVLEFFEWVNALEIPWETLIPDKYKQKGSK